MELRVVVYNVRGFRAGPKQVASAIAPFRPDLALINESMWRWPLRRFARALGMHAVHGRLPLSRRTARNAVTVRSPWRVVDHRAVAFETVGKRYPRGALVAHLGRAGLRVTVAAVHLGLHPNERLRHAEVLTDVLAAERGPVLIGGDLNETPDGPSARWFAERYWDAWATAGEGEGATFPGRDPSARIDYLFVSEGVTVERALVPDGPAVERASDHRPLVVDLSLPD